jgi:CRP/FNR family transcriptional regulator
MTVDFTLSPRPLNSAMQRLQDFGEPMRFRRKETLWSAGEPAQGVFLVTSGCVKLHRANGTRRVTLDLAHRGELLGLDGSQAGQERSCSATALSLVKGVFVDAARLRGLAIQHPEIWDLLLGATRERATHFAQDLEELATMSVEQRLAKRLLDIGSSVGLADARGVFIPLRLTRVELSEMAWCRSETVIRLLTKWDELGWVKTQREGIVLCSLEGLESLLKQG